MSELTYPQDIQYTKEHVWLCKNDDGTATVGITDFAQDQLGEVAYVDLPAVGKSFATGEEFGTVESLKSVSPLYMPVEGTVVAINEELDGTPTLVNMGAYTQGWMMKITIADGADTSLLMSAEDYQSGL